MIIMMIMGHSHWLLLPWMINYHGLNDIDDHQDDHGSLPLTVAPLDDHRLNDWDIDEHGLNGIADQNIV